MDAIRALEVGSRERKNLQLAADMMAMDGRRYDVRETYFDAGQGWLWTTILRYDGPREWVQVLSPRQQEMIIAAKTPEEIIEGVRWKWNAE